MKNVNEGQGMMKAFKTVLVIIAGVMVAVSQVSLALDITTTSPVGPTWGGGDARASQGIQVDNSVMPNCQQGQQWDLEAFVYSAQDSKIYVIGGFDFLSGNESFKTGSLFLDMNGDAQLPTITGGDGYRQFMNTQTKYDYAIDLSAVGSSTYNAYQLTDSSVLQSVYYRQNDSANPFCYLGEGAVQNYTLPGNPQTGALTYSTGLTDAQIESLYGVTLSGGYHNVIGIDLSWLQNLSGLDVNLTLGCGNDQLNGFLPGGGDRVPDGGTTMMLLGLGLSGMALVVKRFSWKS